MTLKCLLAVALWLDVAHSQEVLTLTADNYDEFVSTGFKLVEFYAPWCGHCKALAPELDKAAEELSDTDIKIGKVDATEEEELAKTHEIQGYPTMKIYKSGKKLDYDGPREAAGIVAYLKDAAEPALKSISSVEQVTEALEDEDGRGIVVLAAVAKDSEEWKVLNDFAEAKRGEAVVGETSDAAVLKEYGLEEGSSLVMLRSFDDPKIPYSGDFTGDALDTFFETNKFPILGEIGQNNYQMYQNGKPLAWLFVKSADDNTKAKEVMAEVSKKFLGKVYFVFLDGEQYMEHTTSLGLSGQTFPALAIDFNDKHYAYDESKSLEEGPVSDWVQAFLDGTLTPTMKSEPIPIDTFKPVRVLVARTFDEVVLRSGKDVLVEFYAPWCGHCKELEPTYEKLGQLFDNIDSVIIAKIDATANDINKEYGVRGFPTLKFFPANDTANPVDFGDVERTAQGFTDAIKKHASIPFEEPVDVSTVQAILAHFSEFADEARKLISDNEKYRAQITELKSEVKALKEAAKEKEDKKETPAEDAKAGKDEL